MPHPVPIDTEYWELPRPIRTVAVIGAGASGLPIARRLRDSGKQVRLYERNSYPGGIWNYQHAKAPTPSLPALDPGQVDYKPDLEPIYPSVVTRTFEGDDAEAQVHAIAMAFAPPGPAYVTLKNNIPSPLMCFQGMSRDAEDPEEWYSSHSDHQAYLEEYVARYDINSITKYNTRVEKVDEVEIGWRVWSKTLETTRHADSITVRITYSTDDYDAVVCATGHHNAPATPDITGLAQWQAHWPDRLSHALSFRRGEDWKGCRNVLVVGSGPSGSDMAREISVYADNVYVTTRPFEIDDSPDTKIVKTVFRERLASTCTIVPNVKRFLPPSGDIGRVEMVDGSIIEVDSVLFATGYYHSYPFLRDYQSRRTSESTKIVHSQYTVLNLHQDLFYIPDPTLCLLGVPANISAFSFFEYQGIEVCRVWSHQAQLPSIPAMQKAYAARRSAISNRNLHVYGKVEEPKLVRTIASWLNSEAKRLGVVDGVEELFGYSDRYMAVKARTVEGLGVRDAADDLRIAKAKQTIVANQA